MEIGPCWSQMHINEKTDKVSNHKTVTHITVPTHTTSSRGRLVSTSRQEVELDVLLADCDVPDLEEGLPDSSALASPSPETETELGSAVVSSRTTGIAQIVSRHVLHTIYLLCDRRSMIDEWLETSL